MGKSVIDSLAHLASEGIWLDHLEKYNIMKINDDEPVASSFTQL